MTLTVQDLQVTLAFLDRTPCNGAGEARSLLVLIERLQGAIQEMLTPPQVDDGVPDHDSKPD